MLTDDTRYQAMLARDYRFDGKFFIGVKTTGVYCRPICPARPLRKNVEFFPRAAAAEKAGYRPCLRCHPEAAPLPAAPIHAIDNPLLQRALALLSSNTNLSDTEFAARLNITPRHLRRLFVTEFGQTPRQLAAAHRLNFARKLLAETKLPITQIALTANFHSLRRFNDAFRARFKRTPTQTRALARTPRSRFQPGDNALTLSLPFRPPLHFPHLLSFFRRHALPGLESVSATTYTRLFHLQQTTGLLEVSLPPTAAHHLQLRVTTTNPTLLFELLRRARKMFDLDSDPLLIANAFAPHPILTRLHTAHPGLRLPRGWDPFEMTISAILGQFVSVSYAVTLTAQLLNAYGQPIIHPLTGETVRLFPTPQTLAASDLAAVKTTGARKNTIREISRRLLSNQLFLDDAQDPDTFRANLLAVPGIGPWTAQYIALRALGDPDAFPHTDLILQRALALHPDVNPDSLRPWRAYACIYLWNHYAEKLSGRKATKK
jgi:AraC family transcriptional regulator of adaptative response / DNA-3-methyladenine glycosylase II